MGQLVFQATLGGAVNLVGPNTASTFNLNVPAVSSTIATLAAQTFAGTQTFTVDAVVNGLTVGRGAGAVATNTAVGASALAANTTGANNTGLGNSALISNTTGNRNSSVGRSALGSATTGSDNSALGYFALQSTSTGANNTAVGVSALQENTTASNNTAVGYQAGYSNTVGGGNTFLGHLAGYTFNPGSAADTFNTFVGRTAGYATTTGTYNTFVGPGSGAGFLVTTGSKNTILGGYNGNQGGLDIRTASNYIVLSDGDGNPRGYCKSDGAWIFTSSGTSASHRVYGTGLATGEFALLVDKPTNVNTSAQYFIGFSINTQNTGNGMIVGNGASQAAFATFSDARLKTNIVNIESQLEKVCALRPVEFDYIESAGGGHQTGFIAQEMQSVYPDAVNEDANGMLTVAGWSKTEAYLVKAIQELKAEFDAYKASHP